MSIKRSNISESYDKVPRVPTTHERHTYDVLVEIAHHIDFNHPIFRGKAVRNRSLGSVQMILVEMALQNDEILDKLRKYMVLGGEGWYPLLHYREKY